MSNERDAIGTRHVVREARMLAGARSELLTLLPERIHRIEELVTPYLEALKSTGCVAQFEALRRMHSRMDTAIELETDLSFAMPSVSSRARHFATPPHEESRYVEIGGAPDVFAYDAKKFRMRINRGAIYGTWRGIIAEEVERNPAGPGRIAWIRELLNRELLADPHITAASATFEYDLARGNPVADRVRAQKDDYEDFVEDYFTRYETVSHLITPTVRHVDRQWVLEVAGGSWSVPITESNRAIPTEAQWPRGDIANAITHEYRRSWRHFAQSAGIGDEEDYA